MTDYTRAEIFSAIRYETNQGIHTYHQCGCGRMACRSRMCVLCWAERLPTQAPEAGKEGE